MKSDIIKKRLIKPENFIDKKFTPSLKIKISFIKIFELFYTDFNKYFFIKSIKWDRNNFKIEIRDNKTNELFKLILKDNLWIKKCSGKLCTNNLCNWIHYNLKNKNFLRFLIYFSNKGKYLEINNFLKILINDYKAKKEYYQIFLKQSRPPFSIIQDWNHPLQKFRFVVHEWFFRNIDQSLNLNLPEISIHHSERECQWITPWNKATWYHFFNFPLEYYDHRFDKYYYLSYTEKRKFLYWKNSWKSLWISTDLNENDIVMWQWINKLTKALDYAIKNIKRNNIKLLSFNCCCVPRVIWDDVYSVLKRTKEKLNIPFIFQWQLEKTPYEQKVLLLEEYINIIKNKKIKKTKNSISLFWYHENIYQKELCDILIDNWVKINTSFIPTIDVRLLELMFKSELFVFSPNKFQKEIFEYPFQDLWFKFISPIFPYWFVNSEKWLIEILSNFNINLNFSSKYLWIKKAYYEKVYEVKSKWYKICIVLLWLQETKKFFSSDYMNNVNIIWFLQEMWFELNFLIFDNFKSYFTWNDDSYKISDWNHEKIEEFINNNINKNEKIKINFYSSETDFNNLFVKEKYNLVYSDIYFDDRIINLWINQFNLKYFHVWITWALKTITELINLCEMTFYKNYFKYFNK